MYIVNIQPGEKDLFDAFDDVMYLTDDADKYVVNHEMAHWARHKSRCGFLGIKREEVEPLTGMSVADFGDYEEAIAEMTSSILSGSTGERKATMLEFVKDCLEEIPHLFPNVVQESYKTALWIINNDISFQDNR